MPAGEKRARTRLFHQVIFRVPKESNYMSQGLMHLRPEHHVNDQIRSIIDEKAPEGIIDDTWYGMSVALESRYI